MPSTQSHGKVIPPLMQSILDRLQTRYKERLDVLSIDEKWLNFKITGLTDECAIRELDMKQAEIFGADRFRIHILKAFKGSREGIFIECREGIPGHLPNNGAWYY